MDTEGAGPRRGTRDNGLRCASYVAIADLDPRVADALLEALRDHGIAAYVGPTPATSGGYMELKLPDRPIDRLYVDEVQQSRARSIIDDERPVEDPPLVEAPAPPARDDDIDFDAAWAQLLTSLQPPGTTSQQVQVSEPVEEAGYDPAEHEHFEPPPPPPLPKLRPVTAAALVAIVLGLFVIVTNLADGVFRWPGFLAILGGIGSLIWHMRQGPPTDSGWDDGAVV